MDVNPSEEEIHKVLDEFFVTGYSVKDFCSVTGHDETVIHNWIDKYQGDPDDDDSFLIVNVIDPPQKPSLQKPRSPGLFAKIGDIELYRYVSSDYLKSLKA